MWVQSEQAGFCCRDIMATPVVTVRPNGLIEDALDLMLRHRVSGLPVVDDDGRLVGIVSEFDILSLLFESPADFQIVEPVANFMSCDVLTVSEETSLADLCAVFRRRSVRRVPVMREGRMVGIVSRRDLVKVIREDRCRRALVNWQRDLALPFVSAWKGEEVASDQGSVAGEGPADEKSCLQPVTS